MTFANETPSGWQEVDFATPIAITAGTTYVAGYLAPNGHYSVGTGLTAAVDNAPLHTIPNATSPNGVYDYAPRGPVPHQQLQRLQLPRRRHVQGRVLAMRARTSSPCWP